MNTLYLVENSATQFNFICAFDEEQKRQAYQLRFERIKSNSPNIAYLEQVIDQFDRNSTHLLIQDTQTREYVATVRLSEALSGFSPNAKLPCQTVSPSSQEFIKQATLAGKPLRISQISKLNINPYLTHDSVKELQIIEAAYLAAFSFARLRFDDRILISLAHQDFKRLRSRGLLLEHTNSNISGKEEELFWISSEFGVLDSSPIYEIYQHILGCIAAQMNQAQIDSEGYIVQEAQ